MEIHIVKDDIDMRIPVLPQSFEISDSQNNESVTIHTMGEINLLGTSGLKTVDLSSFFPGENNDYSFIQGDYPEIGGNVSKPYQYVEQLIAWMHDKDIVEFYATDTNINWNATLEAVKYSEQDASGDVNYTVTLKEYREANKRLCKKIKTVKYTTKSGDTLKRIAYNLLGNTKYSGDIYSQNKNAIEKAVKAYIKKYNKKHPKNELSYKSSQKGKHICKGIKLTIKKEIAT